MQRVTHDGRTTAYRATDGTGATVCYVHGSGGDHRVWVNQYGRHDGRPAAALDLSGHGESDDVATEPGPPTLDAYADDLVAVADEAGADVLVGNSLGGAVVMHALLERDLDVQAAVLTGAGAKLGVAEPLRDQLATDFPAAVETLHGPGMIFHDASEEVVAGSRDAMHECGRAVTERDFLTCHAFDVRDRLDEIAVPTLALTGEHDRLTPVSFHEYLAEGLRAGELAVVPDAAHLAFLEAPAAWNEAVDGFLGRVLAE